MENKNQDWYKELNLKELYDLNIDVRESYIPQNWISSFRDFMMGSTCMADVDQHGNVKDFIYYACDFRSWYYKNQKEIERELKINDILK